MNTLVDQAASAMDAVSAGLGQSLMADLAKLGFDGTRAYPQDKQASMVALSISSKLTAHPVNTTDALNLLNQFHGNPAEAIRRGVGQVCHNLMVYDV